MSEEETQDLIFGENADTDSNNANNSRSNEGLLIEIFGIKIYRKPRAVKPELDPLAAGGCPQAARGF